MELLRIGEKVVDRGRVHRLVDRILDLRAAGMSQQDVADKLAIDRTFVSRLESLGEVRKGKRLALVGFPVQNRAELEAVAREEGVEFILLMTERERLDWVQSRSGAEVLNELMALISRAREFDAVIFIGSDMRIALVEGVVGPKVVGIAIGTSPITEDKYVDPERLRSVIRSLKDAPAS